LLFCWCVRGVGVGIIVVLAVVVCIVVGFVDASGVVYDNIVGCAAGVYNSVVDI